MMSEAALKIYLGEVEHTLRAGNATEHSYRGYLKALVEELGRPQRVIATNEPKRERHNAPDYVVAYEQRHNRFTLGYIEAKDVGVSLDETEKGEQLTRYRRDLHNLILTDYLEFRWYVNGEPRKTARLARRGAGGRLTPEKDGAHNVAQLLGAFLGHEADTIRRPKELAERMARLTRMIREIVVSALPEAGEHDLLRELHTAFQKVLLPDLSNEDFADMFAQTLAYGLFAARYNHKDNAQPFRRQDAAREIPKTNPFLRKLFGVISGNDLDEQPFVGFVDDLAQVLALSDMGAVLKDFGKRTRLEDPVVHFYETFLSAYDPKLRELRGVYYTPEPVVSYIVRSVDALLKSHFGLSEGLADTSTTNVTRVDEAGQTVTEQRPRVTLLDPACGTGTFSYMVINHIREAYRKTGNAGMWSGYVRQHLLPRLFSFELLMAPYAVAHLKLGMQLAGLDLPESERDAWAYDFESSERLGIYLTNTLEEAAQRSQMLFGGYLTEEANEASRVKRDYPVMVVLGNPPYSGHSANKGEWITSLLRGKEILQGKGKDASTRRTGNYFEVDGQPLKERNPKWLNDDYVKFLRFGQWRIEQNGEGILAFITNHGYLDNPTFRGMRQSLMQTFDEIYVLDLHGNTKKKERAPDGSKDENVFDIQQGVAIGIFVKRRNGAGRTADLQSAGAGRSDGPTPAGYKPAVRPASVHHAHLWGTRASKYERLAEQDIRTTEWKTLSPQTPFYLFAPQEGDLRQEYEREWSITEIMPVNGVGLTTARDHVVTDFDEGPILKRAQTFRDSTDSDEELCRKLDIPMKAGWNIPNARKLIKQEHDLKRHIKPILYRPFDNRLIFYHDSLVWRTVKQVMSHTLAGSNLALATTRNIEIGRGYEHVFCSRSIIQHHTVSIKEVNYLLPLYLYPNGNNGKKRGLWDAEEPGSGPGGRRANLAPEFVQAFAAKLGMTWVADGKGNFRDEARPGETPGVQARPGTEAGGTRGDASLTFGPEDVFAYLYAIFHAPTYRERYAEFLKIDFPRLPLTSNPELFRALCRLGDELVRLHLLEGEIKESARYPIKGNNKVESVRYTDPQPDGTPGRVYINKTQYFEGVPPEVWAFHIGGYQVCQKWLKDRKGRALSFDDQRHYQKTVAALACTIRLMAEVDAAIEEHGGWPLA